MNIKSCEGCGVVLDLDTLVFPPNIHDDMGCIDDDKAVWCSEKREYVAFVPCPVCQSNVEDTRK